MSCSGCLGSTPNVYTIMPANPSNCVIPCSTGCGGDCNDSANVIYSGPALTCSAVQTGTSVQSIIQTFDTLLCSATGNYSTYNTYCLAPITTQQQFVETISADFCNLQTNYNTFTGTTYVNDKAGLQSQITALQNTNFTSTCQTVLPIGSTDSLSTTLSKLGAAICTIYSSALDLSTVNWSQCITVTTPPTTIAGGFTTLLSQICSINSSLATLLPTFDNSTSCIGGTTTDTLVTTINAVKTRLCTTPTFDIDTLTWNCVSKPTSTGTTDLQDAFQAVLSAIDSLKGSIPTFSSKFIVTAGASCVGPTVDLASTVTDRYVAATSSDNSPGTLQDKLSEGTNITLDYTTTPGKVIINNSGAVADEKVKAFSGDPTAGYLADKLEGNTGDKIYINPLSDNINNKVQLSVVYDPYTVLNDLLTTLNGLPTTDPLYQMFCTIVSRCPDSCEPPTNIVVTYAPATTTTSTSTSTTSTSTTSSSTTSTTTV